MSGGKVWTVAVVEREVRRIAAMAGDDEQAHSAEDSLHIAVLTAIASGRTPDPAGIARAAVLSSQIGFSRWCT